MHPGDWVSEEVREKLGQVYDDRGVRADGVWPPHPCPFVVAMYWLASSVPSECLRTKSVLENRISMGSAEICVMPPPEKSNRREAKSSLCRARSAHRSNGAGSRLFCGFSAQSRGIVRCTRRISCRRLDSERDRIYILRQAFYVFPPRRCSSTVEHSFRKAGVEGSNPSIGFNRSTRSRLCLLPVISPRNGPRATAIFRVIARELRAIRPL